SSRRANPDSVVRRRWTAPAVLAALLAASQSARAQEKAGEPKPFPLPLLGEEAKKQGYELPLPFGVGLVYYNLHRAIEITDVRGGRNGAPVSSVSRFAQFASTSDVNNLNLKLDVWLLPFLNLYAIVGGVWNKSDTNIDVTLQPIRPDGVPRNFRVSVPAQLTRPVARLRRT